MPNQRDPLLQSEEDPIQSGGGLGGSGHLMGNDVHVLLPAFIHHTNGINRGTTFDSKQPHLFWCIA